MSYVTLYDASGKQFQAPSQEAAKEAVDSGQFFFEKPDTSLASKLGLVEAVTPASGPERDGMDRFFVYDNETGDKVSMWAVDARECVQHGSHSWTKEDAEAQMVSRSNAKKPAKAEPKADKEEAAPAAPAAPAASSRRTK